MCRNDKTTTVELRCPICGKVTVLSVKEKDLKAWKSGKYHVQDCFPYLNADERELFLSGFCPKCWDAIMTPDD